MGKLSLAGVSLVAAIPAGLLGWLLVDGFLNHSDKMPMALQGLAGVTLLICALTVLLPPGVLILGSRGSSAPAKAKEESKKAKDKAADEAGEEEVLAGEEDLAEVMDETGEDARMDALLDDESRAGSGEFEITDTDDWETAEEDDDDVRKTRKK